MKHVIYGLCEPGTKFVWYVGYTKFPVEERLEGHLAESRDNNTCHRHRWLRSLVRDGLRPAIVVLEQVTSANWEARERHWIAKLKKPNRLVNRLRWIRRGGKVRRIRPYQPLPKGWRFGFPNEINELGQFTKRKAA